MQTNNSKEKSFDNFKTKLYLTAKKCDSRRFHALYDKVYRDDVLFEAWKRVKYFIDREKNHLPKKDGIPSICYSASPELPRE